MKAVDSYVCAGRQVTNEVRSGYAGVLEALNSIPWHRAPLVTAIAPRDFKQWNFFPGRSGFIGNEFPMYGVMVVANNYDCLDGWEKEVDELDLSPTMRRLRDITIPFSQVPPEQFWFTNYCHGVMDNRDERGRPDPCYSFPAKVCEDLEFRRVFEECVLAMRPRVVVAFGGDADGYLKFPRGEAQPRTIQGHETLVLSVYHTSARGTLDKFYADAERIGRAYGSFAEKESA